MAVWTLEDDFNRPDSSSIGTASDGGAYTLEGGTLGIASNKAVVKTLPGGPWFAGFGAVALRDTGQADVDFTAVVTVTSTDIAMMPFGYNPATRQGYYVRMTNGGFYVYRVNGDTPTNVVSSSISSGTYTIRVTRVAATGAITVYKNGVSTLTATDTTYPSNTWVGVGSGAANDASFDNFSAVWTPPSTISDDFNRSNTSGGLGTASDGGAYDYYGGTYKVASNQAVVDVITGSPNFFGGMGAVALRNTDQVDADVQIDLVAQNSASAYCYPIGYDLATKQGYFVYIDNARVRLYKENNGTSTQVGSNFSFGPGSVGSRVRIMRNNATGRVRVWLDVGGAGYSEQGSGVTDTTYSGGKYVGFGGTGGVVEAHDNLIAVGSIPVIPPRPHRPLVVSGAALQRAACW